MRSFVRAVRLAAFGAGVAAVTFAPDARSYCRTVTHAPPASWNATAQGCFDDSGAGAKALFWKNSCVGYSLYQQASRQVTLEQATAVVAGAFDAWSSAMCAQGGSPSVHAIDLGPVECGQVRFNASQPNQNVIVFRDDEWPYAGADNTLGLTTVTFRTTTGEILGADMEINATQNLVVGGSAPAGAYDLASVITHEAGHFLGLAHSIDPSAVMFSKYKEVARLANDDVQGICAVYAPDGTRATTDGVVSGASCDPTPPGGFSSACSAPAPTSDPGKSGGGCSIGRRRASRGRSAMLLGVAGLAALVLRSRRRRPIVTSPSHLA